MKVEGEFWVWKLSYVEVLFKVDGVSVRLIGEVVNGVISHQVEIPRLTPIITAIMEVDEVFFSSSFDGRSPRVATKGDLVTGIVNLYLEVLEYWTANQEGSVSRNHQDLKTSKDSTNIDGQVDGPFSSAAGVSSKMEGLVHRSKAKMVKVTAAGLKYTEVPH